MRQEEILAYAAGVVDSDGYLTLVRDASYNAEFPYYRIKIGIKQLWPGQALRQISRTLGGKVGGPDIVDGHRPIARWEIYQDRARKAIARLIPYLLVKRKQAWLLLDAHELISNDYRRHPGSRAALEAASLTVQRLNRGLATQSKGAVSYDQSGGERVDFGPRTRVSYLSGVMDSDGSFKIEKRRVKGMINPHYRIKIGAGQVAPSPAIDLLAKTFGGTIRVRGDGHKGHRPLARWSLFDKSAVPALEALLPYLVIKAPQARLLLQLRELKAKGKQGTTEWVHPTRWHRPIKMRKRCHSKAQVRDFDRLYRIVKALHADSPPYELPRSGRPDETGPPS